MMLKLSAYGARVSWVVGRGRRVSAKTDEARLLAFHANESPLCHRHIHVELWHSLRMTLFHPAMLPLYEPSATLWTGGTAFSASRLWNERGSAPWQIGQL